jgi:chromatin segregation and condensation protein Rec8/ScpA/Scc1 (kleisin family)
VAEDLAGREDLYTHYYLRESGPGPVKLPDPDEVIVDVSLFDLLTAYQQALESIKDEGRYRVSGPEVKLADQVEYLRAMINENERVSLMEALKQLDNRLAMVVTLVAVLELARLAEIRLEQPDLYGDIWLIRGTPTVTFDGGIAS